jgi:hypothetical protein
MTQTEALKLALEALDDRISLMKWQIARDAVKEALAQPEQEPVALRHSFDGYGYLYTDMGFGSGWIEWTKRSKKDAEPLYTTPPQRTWVGLTDLENAEFVKTMERGNFLVAIYDIEKRLKELNT